MELLIVDSSAQIIERLAEMLSETGIIKIINRAVLYEQASALLKTRMHDVVLLDAGLPANRSVDLLREIKTLNFQTAVIVLSIHVDGLTKQKFNSAGADFFFDKYHEYEEVIGAINGILAERTRKS
jgi:DNA-binding NarL/FixJ family response regulator